MAVYEARQQTVESQFEASYPDYLDWQKQQKVFASMAGYAASDGVHDSIAPRQIACTVVIPIPL